MSLCHLDQVMVGLPVEAHLLDQVGVRLIETEEDRRRHDELMERHHYGAASLSAQRQGGGASLALRRRVSRRVGGAPNLLFGRLASQAPGSVPQVDGSAGVRAPPPDWSEQPFSGAAGDGAMAQPGFASVKTGLPAFTRRLASTVWTPGVIGGDVCRSEPISRHLLQSLGLGSAGPDARL